ncbi:hypothetical protein Dsin_019464 [Dipteronia sinensis]|uniref:Uncharacterized protein n=1 Tax=Dipteronia sinensis TaxID=43782 RepID=A0AAE0A8N5_9ROSI|nr:hypothetical protein Dsin_019464 [Dipteronia sinensis]
MYLVTRVLELGGGLLLDTEDNDVGAADADDGVSFADGFKAYSTWKRWPSGENTVIARSYFSWILNFAHPPMPESGPLTSKHLAIITKEL